jgi:hypothetical protein
MLIRDPISGHWDAFSANCVPDRRPLTMNMIGAVLGFKSFSEIRFIKGLGRRFQDLVSGEWINAMLDVDPRNQLSAAALAAQFGSLIGHLRFADTGL